MREPSVDSRKNTIENPGNIPDVLQNINNTKIPFVFKAEINRPEPQNSRRTPRIDGTTLARRSLEPVKGA